MERSEKYFTSNDIHAPHDKIPLALTLCMFFKLAPELRNQIYGYIFYDATSKPINLAHFRPPAIMQVCKQTREETKTLMVPAIQDKEWVVPLLVCRHCAAVDNQLDQVLGRSDKPRPHPTRITQAVRHGRTEPYCIPAHCSHMGVKVDRFTIAPWLEKLVEASEKPLKTTQMVQFYIFEWPVRQKTAGWRKYQPGGQDRGSRLRNMNELTYRDRAEPLFATIDLDTIRALVRYFNCQIPDEYLPYGARNGPHAWAKTWLQREAWHKMSPSQRNQLLTLKGSDDMLAEMGADTVLLFGEEVNKRLERDAKESDSKGG